MKKKGEKKQAELNYHTDFGVFTKCIDQINETADVKSTNTQFADCLQLVTQTTHQAPPTAPLAPAKKQGGLNTAQLPNQQCDMMHASDYF